MTIIVPVFNESENLDRFIRVFLNYSKQSKTKSKVLFIDDGSTDNSFEKIENVCHNSKYFDFLKFKYNCGLSTAIKAGIDYIDTPLTGYLDADLQTTPFDFDKLLKDIDNYSAVVGYRSNRKDSLSKKIQSKIANSFRRALVNDGIIDTGCPLKIIHSKIAKKIPFFKGMHRFIPALIKLQGGTIKQVSVQHFKRIAGQSKYNIFNRALKPLGDAIAFNWMRSRKINYRVDKIYMN